MNDASHLSSLKARLYSEKSRLAVAKNDSERSLRSAWVDQLNREIEGEMKFLGLSAAEHVEIGDDELISSLMS